MEACSIFRHATILYTVLAIEQEILDNSISNRSVWEIEGLMLFERVISSDPGLIKFYYNRF